MARLSDIEKLISQTGLGDRHAFSLLYRATSAKLFGICLRVLTDRAEAEDALQDAFIRIWQKADRYAANGYSPMTWLITLTRNMAIDRLRARKAPAMELDKVMDLSSGGPTPEDAAIAGSERARIDACLDELQEGRADAVREAYLRGETYQELADRLRVSQNTMRTWLRRALLDLKECLSR